MGHRRLLQPFSVVTTIMRITYDPNKRAKTLAERRVDFEDAALVFAGETFGE